MSLFFEDLMQDISTLNFSLFKPNNAIKELQSSSKFFYVYYDTVHKKWAWRQTYLLKDILDAEQKEVLLKHQNKDLHFPSWKTARNDALETLKEITGESIDQKMVYSVPNKYYLHSNIFNNVQSNVNIYRDEYYKNKWAINYFKPDGQHNYGYEASTFSHYSTTKEQALQFLYEYVGTNLPKIYHGYNKNVISHDLQSIQNNLYSHIDCWWMMFIKPNIDILTMFD